MRVEQTVFGVRAQLDEMEALEVLTYLDEHNSSDTLWPVVDLMLQLAKAMHVDLDELPQ